MTVEERLRSLGGTVCAEWAPVLMDLASAGGRQAMESLLSSGRVTRVHDDLPRQVADLLEAREPSVDFTPEALDAAVRRHLGGVAPEAFGTWVFYPWSGRLAHLLPRDEFRELRSDRNRYKINAAEQQRLRGARIGVIGLSVGNAVALTLAMEGVGGELRLADPDTLGLSNLNRLRAGVHDLGGNKAVLAARQIAEIDPYLPVQVQPEAIDDTNMDSFLCDGGKLDLLFDECDDLFTKVRARERARELRIPVLMSTDDRGLIDVERFDLEPDRPLFHGLAGHLDAAPLKGLDTHDKVPYVLRILGEDAISGRFAASLVEIDETLSSFPQLASEAALGGAIATHVARRVLLGELRSSGRFYLDIDEVVRDGGGVEIPDEAAPLAVEACEEAKSAPAVGILSAGALDVAAVRSIVSYAVLAASAHNCQPWRFRFRDGRLRVVHDAPRSGGFLDFRDGAAFLALGAATENAVLAAAGMGLEADVRVQPDPADRRVACEVSFERRASPRTGPLLAAIPARATNRRRGARVPLDPADREAVDQAVRDAGGRLQWLLRDDELTEVGEVLGAGDRVAYLSKHMHAELMAGMRWTAEEVLRTRDGIDVATLELSPSDAAGLRLVSRWGAMRLVGLMGSGRVLEKLSKKAVAAASGVALITVEGTGDASYFRGGRAMERAWLTAVARGLAFQPLAMLPYFFARLERGNGEGFTPEERGVLSGLRRRYRALFQVPDGWCEPILFKVGRAEPPTARALRRPVDDVLDP